MNSVDLQIINFLILFTKWFVNRKKTNKLQLYFIEMLSDLKVKMENTGMANYNPRFLIAFKTTYKHLIIAMV